MFCEYTNYSYYTLLIRYYYVFTFLDLKTNSVFESIHILSIYDAWINCEGISLHLFTFIHHIVIIFT